MRVLDLLHRWTGGIVGLILALLGLSGMVLLHRNAWIGIAHAGDSLVNDPAAIAAATERLMALPGGRPDGIIYASESLGLHQLRLGQGAGAYADQTGAIVTRWSSQWQRPEAWIFDFHHHLFAGDFGETVSGVAGLCALLFIVTGVILWWRTRRTFRLRLLPRRMSRPAILTHHRDLGVVAAPLLLLSALTGTMMIFKPVASIVVAPFSSPAGVTAAMAPPTLRSGLLARHPDWRGMIATAHARFPDAQVRILTLPRKAGDPISLRMKRAAEWLPNGRTTLWFDAADGRLLFARDALAMPAGAQVFNAAYPLHAAKVGGLAYRLLMTVSGLAMTMLGSFAVWTFWFRRQSATQAYARTASSNTARTT